MSSTYRQRYYGQNRQNSVSTIIKGQVRLLQICLNYQGTECPLGCTIDGDRIRQIAQKSGVSHIVSLYDDGSTELYPSKKNVTESMIQMCENCEEGDFMIVQYSGHGTHMDDQNGDQSDGQDEAMCLRTQNGQDQYLVDDEIAEIISTYLHKEVPCLFLVDACHSGTIMDLQTAGLWGGRKIFCISGCQDQQTSGDTGDGGQMTLALIEALNGKAAKKRRKNKNASIQFIFNRMVDKMPQEQQNLQQEEQIQQGQEENYEDEEDVVQQPQQGQWLNLSWNGGTDPTRVQFPF